MYGRTATWWCVTVGQGLGFSSLFKMQRHKNSSTKTDEVHYRSPEVAAIAKQIETWERERIDPLKILKKQARLSVMVDPRSSRIIGFWDGLSCLALIFVAFVTPMEIAFIPMPEDKWNDTLFLINRVIDSIFLLDIVLQFFIMYPVTDPDSPQGERWVTDPRKIAIHYALSAWFPIDVFSIAVSGFDIFAPSEGKMSRLAGLRAVRILRLVKLVKIVNASRVFSRWEKKLAINYKKLSVYRVLFVLLYMSHIFACLWGLQASFNPLNTWPGNSDFCVAWNPAVDGACSPGLSCNEGGGWACASPGRMYLYSWYFSLATITSIGYGDVSASSLNATEQFVCCMIMLIGAVMFSFLVGSFCALANSLSPNTAQFRFDLSDLNAIMSRENISSELRFRLREYMHHTNFLTEGKVRSHLFGLFSPGIGGEFALRLNGKWINQI